VMSIPCPASSAMISLLIGTNDLSTGVEGSDLAVYLASDTAD